MDDLDRRIVALVAGAAGTGASRISFDQHLRDDLGLGSLERVDLVLAAEEEFGCSIDDDDVEGLTSVLQFRDLVRSKAS